MPLALRVALSEFQSLGGVHEPGIPSTIHLRLTQHRDAKIQVTVIFAEHDLAFIAGEDVTHTPRIAAVPCVLCGMRHLGSGFGRERRRRRAALGHRVVLAKTGANRLWPAYAATSS